MVQKTAFHRKIFLKVILILLVWVPYQNQAQSVKRQCISCYGTIVTSGNNSIEQTVGQPYNTIASYENKISVLPGFQQSVVFKVLKTDSGETDGFRLSVFPNPATYSVIIQSMEPIENSTIRVLNLDGKVILSDYAEQLQTYNIDCSAWSSGIYIITVSDKHQIKSSMKLIINK